MATAKWRGDMQSVRPMLATLEDAPLQSPALVYEPKYDGIRAIVEIAAGGHPVRLWSRLGNDKTNQFPEIAEALARLRRARFVHAWHVATTATLVPARLQDGQCPGSPETI